VKRFLSRIWPAFLLVACGTDVNEPASPLELLTPAVHDAGTIPFGTRIEHRFRLRNASTEEILADIVKASCGCSEARIEPELIPPGGEAEVHVQFEAESLFGKDVRIVVASSRRAESMLADLHVVARVDGSERLVVEPRALDVRLSPPGLVREETFVVRALFRGSPVTTLSASGPEWTSAHVEPRPMRDLGGGQMERRFDVRVRVDARGHTSGTLDSELVFTADKTSIVAARARIHVVVEGSYSVRPERLFLGSGISSTVQHRVEVQPSADEGLPEARCADSRIALAWLAPSSEGGAPRLEVVFDPSKGDQAQRANRLIETKISLHLEDGSTALELPVTGWMDIP
jgi:hypothetical protein